MGSFNQRAVAVGPQPVNARERILDTAYTLFSRHGVRAVGVDTVVAESGVAKMTLYRHFPSKDDLVLAFLERREELWTRGWVEAETAQRATTPGERLLAIFDIFDEWFHRDDFEGCSFINVLLEIADKEHVVHNAAVKHLATIRAFLRGLAEEVGVRDPDTFSRQWHMLMKGSIVAAGEGDVDAARRAKEVAKLLLAHERVAHELGEPAATLRPPRSGRRPAASAS
ncbi:MAG: TetR/AcrR family transcriptional regulator [Candidatus Rokuibacteriota bacterium]